VVDVLGDVHVIGAGVDGVEAFAVRRDRRLPRVGNDVDVVVRVERNRRAPFLVGGRHQVADGELRKDGAAAVHHVDHRTDMRQVGFRPARVQEDVPAQVVGRMALPTIDDFAGVQIDGVQDGGVKLGNIETFLVRAEGDAADEGRNRHLAQDLESFRVDFADRAGEFVRNPGTGAGAVGDNAVWLRGNFQTVNDLAVIGVDEDDEVFAVNGDGGEQAVTNPGNALGFFANRNFAQGLMGASVYYRDGVVIGIGDQ